ncbi:MAG: DUF4249 domain-containing protein, partial [Hymenobacter sp.]
VEPYMPAVLDAPNSLLVVDGFINGNGRTRIKLSRTASLAVTSVLPIEKGAQLFVVDNTGVRYPLAEKASGSYQSDSLQLNPARQYQLRITTSSNATYESALVPLKVTPAIDKLAWQLNGDEVGIQVDTHDASAQSRFYRWNLVETWEFNAAYLSKLEYFPSPAAFRQRIGRRITPIYTCWRTERPSTIKQTSTSQLSQDALTGFTVLSLSTRAERLKIRYSVLVSQYAQTAEEFAYYELLRKNTEAVGTVNDPLPSQLTGNVHRVDNASEPVLGFVSAHTLQQQRLFIGAAQLPPRTNDQYDSPYAACALATLYFCNPNPTVCDVQGTLDLFRSSNNVPIDFTSDPTLGDGIIGASADCADCRKRGTNAKPIFW